MKIYALLALFCLVPLHAADVFEPEKTWVFAAGILNWEDKKLGTWPDEGRVDQVMIDGLPDSADAYAESRKDYLRSNDKNTF